MELFEFSHVFSYVDQAALLLSQGHVHVWHEQSTSIEFRESCMLLKTGAFQSPQRCMHLERESERREVLACLISPHGTPPWTRYVSPFASQRWKLGGSKKSKVFPGEHWGNSRINQAKFGNSPQIIFQMVCEVGGFRVWREKQRDRERLLICGLTLQPKRSPRPMALPKDFLYGPSSFPPLHPRVGSLEIPKTIRWYCLESTGTNTISDGMRGSNRKSRLSFSISLFLSPHEYIHIYIYIYILLHVQHIYIYMYI